MKKSPLNFIGGALNAAVSGGGAGAIGNIASSIMGGAGLVGSVGQALGGQQSSNFQNQVTESLNNITQKLENSNPGDTNIASVSPVPSIETKPLDNTINTFSSAASEKGASIYGTNEQRQSSVGYPSGEQLI